MKKKKIFKNNVDWNFRGSVVENFDNHINKSVPLYKETQKLYLYLSDFFLEEKTNIVDIGCSTGSFLKLLVEKHKKNKKFNKIKLVGIDNEKQMINKAKQIADENKTLFAQSKVQEMQDLTVQLKKMLPPGTGSAIFSNITIFFYY